MSPYIQQAKSIESNPIVMSNLLSDPEHLKHKASGTLVADSFVVQILFEEMLKPQYKKGVIVDGFPRTNVQAEICKHLKYKMESLHLKYFSLSSSNNGPVFPRPVFHVAIFYIPENISIQRQLGRAQKAIEHNERVEKSGLGEYIEIRETDIEPEAAKKRFEIFKKNFDTIYEMKKHFHFTVIDASGTIEEVKEKMMKEFRYQSSLELSEEAYNLIHGVEKQHDIIKNARSDLVDRLDLYAKHKRELFMEVIEEVRKNFIPQIKRNIISGAAIIRTENPIFVEEDAIQMTLDVLSDRGFHCLCDIFWQRDPFKIDLTTGEILSKSRMMYIFKVQFSRSAIRYTPIKNI